jgi:hypothetical protein
MHQGYESTYKNSPIKVGAAMSPRARDPCRGDAVRFFLLKKLIDIDPNYL